MLCITDTSEEIKAPCHAALFRKKSDFNEILISGILNIEKVLPIDGQPCLSVSMTASLAVGGHFLLPIVYPAIKNAELGREIVNHLVKYKVTGMI